MKYPATIKLKQTILLLVLSTILGIYSLKSQVITIGDGGDFSKLSDAASFINAGDTVILFNGIFTDGTQFLENLNGTSANPVVIQAESPFNVIFQGGTEAIHLINCSYVILDGFIIEQQTGNGINIDDGGDYSSPTHHITVQNCLFRDMDASGNNDFLKLSGLDSFLVKNCQFVNGGAGGSGIDMVGCHHGIIEDCSLDQAGVTGIQAKGGTQHILMRRNIFKDIDQRAINLGGSTGLQFFRPPLSDPIENAFEAADLEVYSNIFIRSWAPIAYVGSVRVKVYNNTFYKPENWVIRILQETTVDGFLSCADNEFRNNIVYLENDLTTVNIGPNTNPESFVFSHNCWYNENNSNWTPTLPVTPINELFADPNFMDEISEDFQLAINSPCIGVGELLPAPLTDFVLNNYKSPPSIGAYEGDLTAVGNHHLASNKATINIFPNPTRALFLIKGISEPIDLQIINSQGTVYQSLYLEDPFEINCSDWPAGIYFVSILNKERKYIAKKVIKY